MGDAPKEYELFFADVDTPTKQSSVKISASESVSTLRDKIFEKSQPLYKDIYPVDLELFKVDIQIPATRAKQHVEAQINALTLDDPLEPTYRIANYYESNPPRKTLHLLVVREEEPQKLGADSYITLHFPRTRAYTKPTRRSVADNYIYPVESSKQLEDFREKLKSKRVYGAATSDTMKQVELRMQSLGILWNEYFQISESVTPVHNLVSEFEAKHYRALLFYPEYLNVSLYETSKEAAIHWMLFGLKLSNTVGTFPLEYNFDCSWDFPIVSHVEDVPTPVKATPKSDMVLRAGQLPTIIMEVASGGDGTDEYKMMLQAAALARIAHRLQPGKQFVVVGIYINNSLQATRYLFCVNPKSKPNTKLNEQEVNYIADRFRLDNSQEVFEFLFGLYNMAALARDQTLEASKERVDQMNTIIDRMNLTSMTSSRSTTSKRGRDDEQAPTSSKRQNQGETGNKLHDAITNAGYTLAWHHLPQHGKDILEPLYTLPENIREATRHDGLPVIIKRVKRRAEVDILKHLKSCGGVSNHIIELLDVLDFDAHWLIVMPDCFPLHQYLHYLSDIQAVYSFQRQFLEGVAFLHANGVAHLDLKPNNIVIEFDQKRKNNDQRMLRIIDFGLAEKDVTTTTMMKDVCGTRGWTAPEIREGQRWNPILADRWACGKVFLYLGDKIKWTSRVQNLVERLMDDDPEARPPLNAILQEVFTQHGQRIEDVERCNVHVPATDRRLISTH